MTGLVAEPSELPSGFADRVRSAQSTFRAVMDAMARPGRVQRLAAEAHGPASLMPASAAVALTLFDQDTPVWLDPAMEGLADIERWLVFHTSAPIVRDPEQAVFALTGEAAALASFGRFAIGSADYPDRSTTLIVQLATLTEGHPLTLRGPGIDGTSTLNAPLSAEFMQALAANHALFPRGLDVVLVADDAIVALPRSTQLTSMGG